MNIEHNNVPPVPICCIYRITFSLTAQQKRDGRSRLSKIAVASLQWNYPFRVTATENENVALLSFDEIMDVFRRQVFMNQYLDKGCDETLHITDVRFSYMRVKIRDSEEYCLLPVWDFLGYEVDAEWDQKATAGELELARSWWNDQSLLTINAIDGSVINHNRGY